METPHFTVSEFIDVFNETVSYAFPTVEIEGEVSGFKISKDRWVFFDLKDETGTVSCFMTIYNLRTPIEDGMKLVILGTPKLTNFGRFSVTVRRYQPKGEGSLKKAFDLLKAKLEKEGLFDPFRKRPLPEDPKVIGVISSVTAAGYIDFCKILSARWGGLTLKVANCGVQGLSASDEICRALDYLNETVSPDVIAILRGGGSKDDLAVFNDELLVRKIAGSKAPVITGIGHEVDLSLADLAADVRASTPSNAAELLTRDRNAELARLKDGQNSLARYLFHYLETYEETTKSSVLSARQIILEKLDFVSRSFGDLTPVKRLIEARIENATLGVKNQLKILESLNPDRVLKQGYSILTGKISPGNVVKITTYDKLIEAKVENVHNRKNL
ncbi:exodeoxyribonuclease VII large subunit [Candidatus Saccharibacteria bacterium]|nr:exodeoxyribonuclease VII large subunit [Candidatus Saccharibacteria bacterium]